MAFVRTANVGNGWPRRSILFDSQWPQWAESNVVIHGELFTE